jgi:hypothetical protein
MTRRVHRRPGQRRLEGLNVWRAFVTVPGRERMEFRGANEQAAYNYAWSFARNVGHPDAEIITEPPQ